MPTSATWIDDDIYATTWTVPLTPEELRDCFMKIAAVLKQHSKPVNVLFDLSEVDAVPYQAPYIAMKSGFMWHANGDRVAVISTSPQARMLANIIDRVTRREIVFFSTKDEALCYLQPDAVQDQERR